MSSVADASEEEAIIDLAQAGPSVNRFAVFSNRNFTIFWLSLIFTNTGTWMAAVAEGWLITDLEPARKSFFLGLIAIAFAVPMMVLPPFGGVVADRLPKVTALRITQVGFLVVNSTVAVFALSGHITVHVLIAGAFMGAVVLAFDSPIRHSMVPDLVPRSQLTSAVSINAVAFSGAGLVGPAIGGLLIPLVSPGGVFLINAISSVSVLVALQLLKDLPDTSRSRSPLAQENPRAALKRAFRHMRESPLLFGLFIMALVAGFFGRSYTPMLPVFSRDVYEVGSTANGILISAGGLGALVGGLGLSAFSSDLSRRGRLSAILVICQGALLVVLAVTDTYLLGLVTLALMGALGAAAVALITTLVQEHVPVQFRGRVMGFFLLTMISFPSAGSFVMGLIADLSTIQWAIAAYAVIVMAGSAYVMVRNPALTSAQ
jgi:MFS transporter, DHA1 family, staphyloferrin A biosynthesis exporter